MSARKAQAKQSARPAPSRRTKSHKALVRAVTKPKALKRLRGFRLHLLPHLIIAGSAIAVLMLLGFVDQARFATFFGHAEQDVPATIGLEYDGQLSLNLVLARKENAGTASITNRSNFAIKVSLPSAWTRAEVIGTSIANVKQEIPVFGFVRWTLPAHAGMRLLLPEAPASVFFESPSSSVASIELTTIDLQSSDVTTNVMLLKNQLYVGLWKTSNE